MNSTSEPTSPPNAPQRRSFLTCLAAAIVGGTAVLFPFAAASGVLFNPLRRRLKIGDNNEPDTAGFVRICPLDALPSDGTPHQFLVTTDVVDAWTRAKGQRIGSVFLVRTDADGNSQIIAFSATCPHLGCAVEFDSGQERFECPCHESGFGKDGEKLFGPSLRGLDPLEVKLVDNDDVKEIWVAFQRFRAGVAERIPNG